jgi:hypothetical protein
MAEFLKVQVSLDLKNHLSRKTKQAKKLKSIALLEPK